MARVFPQLNETELNRLKSNAERKVYHCCAELNSELIVVFSFPWIKLTSFGTRRDGETDFLLFHKTKGILSVEVKGGGVAFEPATGKWTSTNRNDEVNPIKDPFRQAHDCKQALNDFLNDDRGWQRLNLNPTRGHAVLVPDINKVSAQQLQGSGRQLEIIGCDADLKRFPEWIDSVFDFWHNPNDTSRTPLGTTGMEFIKRRLCTRVEVKPALSSVLADEEQERIRLTTEQSRTLSLLRNQKKAAISGGAGTGKTVLALEKAKSLAASGVKTLLLCYNSPLADHLKEITHDVEHLHAMSFHQLCKFFSDVASDKTGRDFIKESLEQNRGKDKFDVCFPYALDEAIPHVDLKFDAIIIDEAQDFRDDYWMPIDTLLEDDKSKHLYVFFDPNQQLYEKNTYFPITDPPYPLSFNCRNTKIIHDLAYQFYEGDQIESSPIPGEPVETIVGPSLKVQSKRLHSHLLDLLKKDGVSPSDICILVPSENTNDFVKLLRERPLPTGAAWIEKEMGQRNKICIETVKRFKGLEATYIYFWGADEYNRIDHPELLYVTISRAKSRLCVVGTQAACDSLLSGQS
jgi:hypothetical protein